MTAKSVTWSPEATDTHHADEEDQQERADELGDVGRDAALHGSAAHLGGGRARFGWDGLLTPSRRESRREAIVRLPDDATPPRAARDARSALALAAAGCGSAAAPTGPRPTPRSSSTSPPTPSTPGSTRRSPRLRRGRGRQPARARARLLERGPQAASRRAREFALLDIHDLALARQQGRDIVGVLALVQRPLAAVLAAPDIRAPRRPRGPQRRRDRPALRQRRPALGGVGRRREPGAGREVTIGFNAVATLLGGRVDAATAFWNVEGVALAGGVPASGSSASTTSARPRIPSSSCASRADARR